jgi:hypothetical protein
MPGLEPDSSDGSTDDEPRPAARTHHLLDEVRAEEHGRLGPSPGVDVSDDLIPASSVLRQHVDDHAEELWAVFADALAATTDAGRPDHRVRLSAAKLLLAEVYGQTSTGVIGGMASDELAALRSRRRQSGSSS